MRSLRNRAFITPLSFITLTLAVGNITLDLLSGSFRKDVFFVSIAIIVLAIPYFYRYAQRLVQPIGDLVPQAAGIARGRLEVSNHGEDDIPIELQSLAKTINEIGGKQARDFAAMQKLERVRSEFLANVSHELRTPIFAVQGFLETLLEGAVDDPKVNRDFLQRAGAQAERLNALLSDLIDISRIESGEMRMSFRLFDIQPFLRELVDEMQGIAEQKKIELYFSGNILPHHEVDVFGDKERIKQVMVNLIDNAVKYTNSGGSIKVELLNESPEIGQVTIRIQDTGIGIPPEHLPRLFERFYRVDKDRSRTSPGGTGLGLAICKHIVEAHRGKIWVESVPSKGSVFSFTLQKHPD
ncbi:MAG: ATP-binding protein [Bacteroidota bacterium]|nr:ATP-binding protein [Bacteroidota bacterium]MDP4230303.1 ATP-binding protein [Bacteroidota bacterium]MDP4236924.1 ATP-binding protein [Bacteroidota bacterium]